MNINTHTDKQHIQFIIDMTELEGPTNLKDFEGVVISRAKSSRPIWLQQIAAEKNYTYKAIKLILHQYLTGIYKLTTKQHDTVNELIADSYQDYCRAFDLDPIAKVEVEKNILTHTEAIEYLNSQPDKPEGVKKMKGSIRLASRSRICVCGTAFTHISKKLGYICKQCKAIPNRFLIDIYHNSKRIYIYTDQTGQPLDTYTRALRLQSHIHTEIANNTFSSTNYIKSELEQFYFSHRILTWLDVKEKEVQKQNLAPATLKTYRKYVKNYIQPFFKLQNIRTLRTYDIEAFYMQLPNTFSAKYQQAILNCLKTFLKSMHRLEYIQSIPLFPVIRVPEKSIKWITRDIQNSILNVINEADRPIFSFLSLQGLRPSEARALKISDINFSEGFMIVQRTFSAGMLIERTKSRTDSIRVLAPESLQLLKTICKNRFPSEYVFLNPRTKIYYSECVLGRIWQTAQKVTENTIRLYNATRHSLGSQAGNAGVPLQSIQAVLGHSDIRMTKKYTACNLSGQQLVFDSINNTNKTNKKRIIKIK